MVAFVFYIVYALQASSSTPKEETNVRTSSRDIALFIMLTNAFTVFIVAYSVALYIGIPESVQIKNYHFPVFFLGAPYIFLVRYLLLQRFKKGYEEILVEYAVRNYSAIKIRILSVLFSCLPLSSLPFLRRLFSISEVFN